MQPVSPIVPGLDLSETIYAKDQAPYKPLPVYRYADGTVLMRWKMSWIDRVRTLFRGDVYVWLMTFNQPLQPIALQTERPTAEEGE